MIPRIFFAIALSLPSLCRRHTPTEPPSVPTLTPAAPEVPAVPDVPTTPSPDVQTVTVDAAVQALRPDFNAEALAMLPVYPCVETDRTTMYHAMHLQEEEWALGCARFGRWSLGAAVPMNRQVTAQLPGRHSEANSLPLRMQLLDGNALLWQQREDIGMLVPEAIRERVLGGESTYVSLDGFSAEAVNGVRLDIRGESGEDYREGTTATILFRWRAGQTPLARVYEGAGGGIESQMDTCSKITAVDFRIPSPGVLERTERVTARFTSQPLDRALLATLRRGCRSVAPHTEIISIQP